jgi:serine/threonine-protein kinase
MIEFRTLGVIDLRDPGREDLRAVLSQPKRLALLAYLALNGTTRRDILIAHLWPDLDQEHARGALRQSLRGLRRVLGPEGGLNHFGEEALSLERSVLWCDATSFEAASLQGRHADALALYGGDLLPGLYVPGAAPEFDQWLEGERTRFRRLAGAAAWALSDQTRRAGDSAGAANWGRRAVQLAPHDEEQVRRLLRLLDELGDRAGAVHAYEQFAGALRGEFEVDPAPETTDLIKAIRGRQPTPRTGVLPPVEQAGPTRSLVSAVSESPSEDDRRPVPLARRPRWARMEVLAVLLAVVALAGFWIRHRSAGAGAPLSPLATNRILVAPFQVTSSDSSLNELRDGMVDLLATELPSDGGPSVVDPGSALAAWHRAAGREGNSAGEGAARAAAIEAGAGRLIVGEVVGGTGATIFVTARLIDTRTGHLIGRSSVGGPVDSLSGLVDRLSVELLEAMAALPNRRFPPRPAPSLAIVRAFLRGQAEYRRARFVDADEAYSAALDLDSTYLPAALGLIWSSRETGRWARGVRLAWPWRQKLTAGDRTSLIAIAGSRYPDAPTEAETLRAWEQAADSAPDRAEVWTGLGDRLVRMGAALGVPDWPVRAEGAFRKAIELDSTAAGPIEQLLELAARSGDTATVRDMMHRLKAFDPPPGNLDFLTWMAAVALADSGARVASRLRLPRMDYSTLFQVVPTGQFMAAGLDDARMAADLLPRRAPARGDLAATWRERHDLALNEGRPDEALVAALAMERLEPRRGASTAPAAQIGMGMAAGGAARLIVLDALYAGGSDSAGQSALRRLPTGGLKALSSEGESRALQERDLCIEGQWQLLHGQTAAASRTIALLVSGARYRDSLFTASHTNQCLALLGTMFAVSTHQPDAASRIQSLDSLLLQGVPPFAPAYSASLLVLARELDRRGEPERALATVRRGEPINLLAPSLLLEARLSAKTGDRVSAIRAYQHYLALRTDPEPSIVPEVVQARAELASVLQHTPP